MDEKSYEINFDGLVGPTHNYGGLAFGNVPAMRHKNMESNPKDAALQGLQKMKFLTEFGLVQGVFPPHERPHIPTLKAFGFTGSDEKIIETAFKESPDLFFACCSAAGMWTANSATITASVDSEDGHVHITPANLASQFHRSFECKTTQTFLKRIFKDPKYFTHHDPIPSGYITDEGAANTLRLSKDYGTLGINIFVYGKYAFKLQPLKPTRFPARQTYEASRAVARNHKLFKQRTLFFQQSPKAIDTGVFHNDVISTANRLFFLYHESAFVSMKTAIDELKAKVDEISNSPLICYEIKENTICLEEAVESYLFNSQIVNIEDDLMMIVAPFECKSNKKVAAVLDKIVHDPNTPIKEVHYLDLEQSMQNGGGPACLRLKVPLKESEVQAIHKDVLLSEKLYVRLIDWVEKHYRDRLKPKDLVDPLLHKESQKALDELTQILHLGPIYSFQK